MKKIEKISNSKNFPMLWANLDYFPDSKGCKNEIYLIETENLIEDLVLMFYTLFKDFRKNIHIYNVSWWDYCLDTWNPAKDEYNYELAGKSNETRDYLQLLRESEIELGYSGSCDCLDWDNFLLITLKCVVTHQAPYSPIFYDDKNDFFFYFHYSGSIGFYYKEHNNVTTNILKIASEEYDIN